MAFVIADRIKETSTTTGTGTFTLDGAVTGFQSFSAIGNSNTTGYCIFAVDANGVPTGEWETGIGTYTSSGTTLSRGLIASSTGSAINFSAGTKHVICCDIANYLTPLVMATTANKAIQVANQTALSSTSGNARGPAAVDLQIKRASAGQVASGNYSTVSGGRNNTASSVDSTIGGGNGNTSSNNYSTVSGGRSNGATGYSSSIGGGRGNTSSGSMATIGGGYSNTNSGVYSTIAGGRQNTVNAGNAFVGGGLSNTASATYACVPCGYFSTASGVASMAIGYRAIANKRGQIAFASGSYNPGWSLQSSLYTLSVRTTTNASSEMFLGDGSSRLTLSNDTTWAFQILIVARRTDADGTNSSWSASGCIKRDTNAASTALVGTCTATLIQQDAGAAATAVTITADTTNGALIITVTGETSKTYQWHALVTTSEVTG